LSKLIKSAAIISLGTGIAQIIPFIALPILTRLYGLQAFGEFTLYFSVVSITSIFLTLQMEQIIVISKTREEAQRNTNGIILQMIFIMSLVYFIFWVQDAATSWIMLDNIYIYLIPASALASATTIVQISLLLWNENYKIIALTKVMNAISYILFSCVLGLLFSEKQSINGLILGWSLAQMLVAFILWQILLGNRYHMRPQLVLSNYKKYKDIIIFNFPSTLADRGSQETPNISIPKLYGLQEVGIYGMVVRLLGAPISLFGLAIYQVLLKQVASLVNEDKSIASSLIKSFILLLFLALGVTLAFSLITPDIYAFVLGEQWRGLSEIVVILLPMFFMKILVSPLSSVLIPLRKLRPLAIWQFSYLAVIISVFLLFEQDFQDKLHSLVIVECVMYIAYLTLIFFCVWQYEKNRILLQTKF
jgi:O-antigen/teichoic acid export membrane protein